MFTSKNSLYIKTIEIIGGCFLFLFLFALICQASCPYGPGTGSCSSRTCDGVCCSGSCCEGSCGCTPNCTGKTCGSDGCGGSCGTCAANQNCTGGSCVNTCTPNCTGKCGGVSDGCGGTCNAACACTPNCTGKTCGSDGCGGSCGTCGSGTTCSNGNCVSGSCDTPCSGSANCRTCDFCTGTWHGGCQPGQTCSGGTCISSGGGNPCTPSCAGKSCGDADGCGGACIVQNCPTGKTCVGGVCAGQATSCTGDQACTKDGCAGVAKCFAGMLQGCVKNDPCCNFVCLTGTCVGGTCVNPCTRCETAECGQCSSLGNGYECQCSGALAGGYANCVGVQTATCNTQYCCQLGSNNQCCFHVVNGTCVAVGGTQTQYCSQCPPDGSHCGTNGRAPCTCGCSSGLSDCVDLTTGGRVCASVCPTNKYSCDPTNKICYINTSGSYSSLSDCSSACVTNNKCGCDSNNQPTCSASGTGASCASASECTCAPKTCSYTVCECSGGSCSTVTKSGTVPCPTNGGCRSCPTYNTCSDSRTCTVSHPGGTIMTGGSCPTGCASNAECGIGSTKDCHWLTCSGNSCSISNDSTIPVTQSCPTGCNTNNDCSTTQTGTAVITSSCGGNTATVNAVVNGGVSPYTKYTWYKQSGSTGWTIDYSQSCSSAGCSNSHAYILSGQVINVYLAVGDSAGNTWASNILNINCSTTANKCGIDANGAMFCSTSGTGTSCNSVSDCGVCKKR